MIIKNKKDCTVTILDRSELGLNSSPFLKVKNTPEAKTICEEVHSLMVAHGMSCEEAEKTHMDNLEWAM